MADLLEFVIASGGSVWTPYNKATLWANTNGTGAITAAGQTFKRIDDVSGRGWHLTNATGNLYQEDEHDIGYGSLSGATGAAWTTTAAQAAFKFLHDGTGGTIIAVVEKDPDTTTRTLVNTGNTPGFALTINLAGLPITTIRNATPANVAVLSNPQCFPFSAGTRRVNVISFSSAAGIKLHADGDPDAYGSAAQTNTPSTANSSTTFQIASTMKGKLLFLAALPVMLTSAQQAQVANALASLLRPVPAWTRPIILHGQSNQEASGVVTSSVELPDNELVAMYDRSDHYRVATEPLHDKTNWIPVSVGTGSQRSGHGLPMAKNIAANSDEIPLLVPCGVGGTSIDQWMPTADRFDRTTLYGSMNARTRAVLDANPTAEDPVFVLFGHEQNGADTTEDFVTGTMNTVYQEKLVALLEEIRSDYPDSILLFSQLASRNTANASQCRAQEALRQCEAAYGGPYSIPNSYMDVAFDVQRNPSPDDVHVSEAGQKVVGLRKALSFRQHVLGEAINGTGPRLIAVTLDAADVIRVKYDKTIDASATDYGDLHRVYDDGVEATVSTAARDAGDNTSVLLTLSAPTSGLVCVTYGERNTADATALTDFVKDSDGLPAPTFRVYDIQPT